MFFRAAAPRARPTLCSWRFLLYALASFAVALGVVQHALATRQQFYSVVIYLVTSKFSLLVLSNFAVVLVTLLVLFLQYLFLGRLEPREVEVRAARPPPTPPPP